jgi:hypothetical protein
VVKIMEKKTYEKPSATLEKIDMTGVEAYSAAAAPLVIGIVGVVAAVGAGIIAAIYTKNC